jgi:hypothetical protein
MDVLKIIAQKKRDIYVPFLNSTISFTSSPVNVHITYKAHITLGY